MGDPVTTGMIIGAVGGAATSKNPIEGAMMGGAMGAAGGSFAGGAMGAGGAGGGFAGGGYGSVGSAPTFMQRLGAGSSSLMGDVSSLNKFMNANPTTSQMGFGLAKNLMAEDQPIQMPGGMPVSRGQVQPTDFMSLLNPQQSQVIRPQSISLLG